MQTSILQPLPGALAIRKVALVYCADFTSRPLSSTYPVKSLLQQHPVCNITGVHQYAIDEGIALVINAPRLKPNPGPIFV